MGGGGLISLENWKLYCSSKGKVNERTTKYACGSNVNTRASNIFKLMCLKLWNVFEVGVFWNSGKAFVLPKIISETYSVTELISLKLPILFEV